MRPKVCNTLLKMTHVKSSDAAGAALDWRVPLVTVENREELWQAAVSSQQSGAAATTITHTERGNVREIFNCCKHETRRRQWQTEWKGARRGCGWLKIELRGSHSRSHVANNLQQAHFQFQSCQNMQQILTLTVMEKSSGRQRRQQRRHCHKKLQQQQNKWIDAILLEISGLNLY